MGPTLSLARHTPAVADTHSLQLGAVTNQVCHLQIGDEGDWGATKQLFSTTPALVMGQAPPPAPRPLSGLNKPARRAVVSETAEVHKLALLCLQETKIEERRLPLARETHVVG
uniref:Uncharacterized protein n=1 Tax=Triticum aestivum TaxID=4565 RepID=A0A077S0K1_WHEAT|nr:unnamed protein product [Triticum aestivum]